MDDRHSRILVPKFAPRHPVDPNLPAHWRGIERGQSEEQRVGAILGNIKADLQLKMRGLDPKQYNGPRPAAGMSAAEALAAVARVKRRA